MTCYLTSHDDRFAAAVAGGVVSDLVSMVRHVRRRRTSSAASSSAARRGASRDALRRDVAAHPRSTDVTTPTLVLHGAADLRCPVGQAQQWHTALRERGVPTELVLYPDASHLFILDGPPSHRLDYNQPRRRLGRAVRRRAAAAPRDRRRALAAPARASWPSGTACPAPRSASCGYGPDGEDELVEAAYGVLNTDTGVDGDRPTRSSRSARSPRSGPRRSSCSWSTRACSTSTRPSSRCCPSSRLADPDVTKQRHAAAPAHPHQRHRRRRLHRHRPRRRLPREVRRPARRRGAEPPARRDLVVLQLRLLAARPGHREAHRARPGTRRCASGSSRRSA